MKHTSWELTKSDLDRATAAIHSAIDFFAAHGYGSSILAILDEVADTVADGQAVSQWIDVDKPRSENVDRYVDRYIEGLAIVPAAAAFLQSMIDKENVKK